MKISWTIEQHEIDHLQQFVATYYSNAFVRNRIAKNIENPPTAVHIDEFWQWLVSCRLTSVQRSGPNSPVTRFLTQKPFPLSWRFFQDEPESRFAAEQLLRAFGGIRFTSTIPDDLSANFTKLSSGLWAQTVSILQQVIIHKSPATERMAAGFIREHFNGIGPKQARNLLQSLGLTQYEIPIDSRITKWLNEFGFPLQLSSYGLADEHYYNFVSDGIQAICKQSGILPCVLDAAIFSSYDGNGWTDENII